jgi:dipeptidyl aminopeptidase/acylaminoacyl peptidase
MSKDLIKFKREAFVMTEYKPKPLPFDELMSLPTIILPTLTKDKKKLFFYYDKTGRIELYVMDIKSKKIKQISKGEIPRAPRTGFKVGNKGEKVFFGKDVGGNEQNDIWVIDVNGNAKALSEAPNIQEHVVDISNDNLWLTYMSTKSGQLNVHKMKIDGTDDKQLTASDIPVFGGSWSPDDKWLTMVTNEMKTNLENEDIYLFNIESNDMQRVVRIKDKGSQDRFSDWAPDSKSFAFTSDASGLQQVGIYNLETKEIKWLGDGKSNEIGQKFNPSGTRLAVLRNFESTIKPCIYEIETGQARELKIPEGLAYNIQWLDDDKILFTFVSALTREETWIYNLTTDKYEVFIEAEYGSINKSDFIQLEYIKYKSFDGLEIPAILYKPKDVPEGVKLPAIVFPHGGPTSQYFRAFVSIYQYVTSEGFVMILPNIRGSSGYSVEFRDACIKDWGGKDLQDVIYAKKYLETLPYVDPERIGIGGGSYGGFMTFIAVTKAPEHWKAGFAWVGISDFFKMYEESMPHYKYLLNKQMGDPINDKELWYDRSAVNFAENMTSHLMILHGATDPRCPLTQAEIFRDKLLELGKKEGDDFEYVVYEDVGHGGLGDIETRKMSMKEMVDYFKRRL